MELFVKIATILSGFSTLFIAVLTIFLVCENRKLRLLGNDPSVIAYFEPHPDGAGGVNLVVENVGTGPATNVTFEFGKGSQDFKNYSLILDPNISRPPLTIIPQGGSIKFLFGIGYQLFKTIEERKEENKKSTPLNPFELILSWQSLRNKTTYRSSYILDIRQFEGLPGMLSKPYLLRIAQNIETLNKNLNKQLDIIKNNQRSMLDV